MKITFKSALCVLLCLLMVSSFASLGFSQTERITTCDGDCEFYPTIIVPGLGQSSVIVTDDNGNPILDKDGKKVSAFPAWIQGSGEDVVAINVGNADIDIGKVTVGMKSMESLSLIIPSSLVLCGEGADSRKDAGYSMSALMKNRIFFDRSETPEQDRVDGVMAYAIASRLKELEDSGQMDAILVQSNYRDENSLIPSAQARNMPSDVPSQKSPYRIISFVREADSDFAYDFALEISITPTTVYVSS